MYLLSMMAKLPTILASVDSWRHDWRQHEARERFVHEALAVAVHPQTRRGAPRPNEMEGASPATGRGWLSMAPPAQHPIL